MTVFFSGVNKDQAWAELERRVKVCTRCGLCTSRRNAVFGEGSKNARVIFVGEAPGADEDSQGLPFVGMAGQLLTQILSSVGIDRKDVFITNIVKCRPPENRPPVPDEMMDCAPYLEAQLALLAPPLIVCLGNTPTKWLLKTSEGITALRGRWFDWRGSFLLPMFHPSYLLRNESKKKGSPKELTWRDINTLREKMEALSGEGGKEGKSS